LFNLKGSENSYFSLPIFWAIRWKPQFWLVCLTPRASNQQTYPQILWELDFRELKILRFFVVGIVATVPVNLKNPLTQKTAKLEFAQ
jgi:hypothetical protein